VRETAVLPSSGHFLSDFFLSFSFFFLLDIGNCREFVIHLRVIAIRMSLRHKKALFVARRLSYGRSIAARKRDQRRWSSFCVFSLMHASGPQIDIAEGARSES
jgi:hypothetical protein